MPFVAGSEALGGAFTDLARLAAEQGPPPWRLCLVGTAGLRVVLLCWPPGFATVPHRHPHAEETFEVLRGQAAFTIGDEPERIVEAGTFVFAARGVRHSIRVPRDGPLLLLAAVAPNEDRPDETIEPA